MTDTARPEDAVACPACAKAPGDSCDGPLSHPARRFALEAAHVAQLGRFEREIAAARASAGVPPQRPHFAAPISVRYEPTLGAPGVHRPTIARTLNEGPGNATRVCGCSCGAATMSAEAFAVHVGVPVAAVRALLDLVGIVYDLIHYPTMDREVVERRLTRALEFSL